MSRIFKFSKFALKLFVSHASKLTDMKISIYTDNFDIAYVATSGFKINVNEVGLVIPQNAVSNMTDGVINYRIEGYLNGDLYIEQRQSNYYLKTPSFEMQDTNIVAVSTEFVDGGDYKMIIKASEYNADGLSQVEIDATTFAEEKYEEGKAEQKSLLEPITITENGTYENENGFSTIEVNVEGGDCPELEEITINENGTYEGAYDKVIVDVPQEGGGDINPDTLREITITENGVYTSKYSTPIEKEVTGIFDDGTPFYGYGELNGIIYNTQYTPQQNENGLVFEKVEFWYKGDNITTDAYWNVILSSAPADDGIDTIEFRYYMDVNDYLSLRVDGINDYQLGTIDDGYWYHFLLYMENGNVILKVNDQEVLNVPKQSFTQYNPVPFYINGAYYDTIGDGWEGNRNANGCFGMIKIDDQTFIPTENGFINYNTQESLPVVKEGDYTYNTTDVIFEGEPYKTINVDIQPKIGSITITENGTYYPQDETIKYLMFDGDDVFDLGQGFIQDTDDMTIITIDLRWVGDETGEPMNICGVENSDWDSESCFAIRYYDGNYTAKVGSFEMNFPADNEWHHMELGYQNGVGAIVYDGNIYQEELGNFTKPTGNIYVGATNTGGEIFRPFRGYIGDIIIVGNRGEIIYYPINNGFSCNNSEEITDNIGGGYCALEEEIKPNTAPIGYNEIHVNVGDCPVLEEVTITENGSYEGAYNRVIVDVPQEGGGCNLEPLCVAPNWQDRDESNYVYYYPSEGNHGFDSANIDLYPVYEEGKQEVINGLGHLVATEQKTYTAEKRWETRRYVHLDGDDYFYNPYQSTAELREINLEFRYEDMQPETYLLGNETYHIKILDGGVSALKGGYYTNPISIPSSTWINAKFDENGLSVTYDGNTFSEPWQEGNERYPLLGGLIIGNNSLSHPETRFYGDISTIEIHDGSNLEVYKPFPNGFYQGSFATLDGNMYENQGDGSATFVEESYEVGVDGWKSVEVNVDAGEIAAQTARVLDITENGTYKSQYSEPTYPDGITGVFPNGENFYSYAQLTNKVFNTGIKLTENTKIEVWYKPKETGLNQYGGIVGTIEANTTEGFSISTNKTLGSISGRIVRTLRHYRVFKPNWVHIELSFADGFVVDGTNLGTYSQNTRNFEKFICINKYINSADGYFGMVKITSDGIENVFIPTANGFLNTNTGRLLEVEAEGDYVFTEELPIYSEGNLIKTINVNVQPNLIPIDKTITKNGTYLFTKQEGMDGYSSGKVVVDVPTKVGSITINKNGVYDLTPKEYFYMDDDRFELFEGGEVANCCKIVFKVLSPGADIIYGGQYKIEMVDMNHIRVAWGLCGGTFEIEENEWNTIEIFGYTVVINGVLHEMEQITDISTKSMLYLGDAYYNGAVFMFNEFSFWKTQDAFLSNETPDYIVKPGNDNTISITSKDGEISNSPNINEGASVNIEIDQPSEYGWNKVDVMVKPKLPNGVKFANASVVGDFPDDYDFSEVRNFSQMFSTITGMTSIPMIETSNATTMSSMFEYCRFLKEVPLMNTENVTNMYRMFKECDKLESIPHFDTSQCTEFDEMFWGCESLKTIPQLDTSKATSLLDTFWGCTNITTLPALDCTSLINGNDISSGLDNLVEFGGWLNLKVDAYIQNLKHLSYNSCRNIINGLATASASDKQYLYVSQEFLDTAGYSLIAEAERKNWVVDTF